MYCLEIGNTLALVRSSYQKTVVEMVICLKQMAPGNLPQLRAFFYSCSKKDKLKAFLALVRSSPYSSPYLFQDNLKKALSRPQGQK